MKIKVCGISQNKQLLELDSIEEIDFLGLIFHTSSARKVLELSKKLKKSKKVGVFVNADLDFISKNAEEYALDFIQLHGNESPEFCREISDKYTVIKAFGVDVDFNFNDLHAYKTSVDYFLFDTKTEKHGGSGKKFNWEILSNYKLNIPFFIAGGISTDDSVEIKKINHPQFYGIDINSKFEISPGIKDEQLIKNFINELN